MIHHISHTDLDGLGCHIVMRHLNRSGVHRMLVAENHEVDDVILKTIKEANPAQDSILITDLSPSSDEAINALTEFGRVQVVDHHQTALTRLRDYEWAYIDTSICATLLLFKLIEPSNRWFSEAHLQYLCEFAELVNDYDMWRRLDPRSERLNILYYAIGREKFFERFMHDIEWCEKPDEEAIIDTVTRQRAEYIERAVDTAVCARDKWGVQYVVVFSDNRSYASYLGNHLLNNFLDAEYAKIINMQTKSVSLRSRGDFDVSIIAQENGGGGHKAASGHPLTREDVVQALGWDDL